MNIYVENINDIIHETSVDFVTRPCSREIHIVQYDKSLPVIKVNLFREGQPYQLPNSALVHVRLGKLDNTFVYTNILGMNEDRTIAYFEVTEQMAMIAGRVSPVIEVVYQRKVACSSPIPFVISKNPVQEGQIESHDEFPIIYQLESDVEDNNEWIRKYTALTEFDGFVKGESVWDGIAEGEIKYCQSGSQTEDVPGENTVIKIDLSQQHLSKSESKALYIKKIVINYTPDGQTEKTYEYTFNSRIFGSGTALPTIEPEYADLTDVNSGTTLRWYLNYLLQEGVSQYFGNYNGTKGQQFGSNNNPPALISLSTSSLENCTVNSIYVEVSSNGGTQAKCKLTIVNDVWTCNNIQDPQITSNNAQYKWLHEPNGTHLGSSSGGQVIHHYNHVFLKKENGKVIEVQPDPTLQYVLNDYSSTYKYSTADNLLHQIVSSFEVLSKIEFTHDIHNNITVLRFPKNIMPSVMYNDSMGNYLYFDYVNNKVLNYEGKNIIDPNHAGMWTDNGCLTVSLIGDWIVEPEYDFIKYDVYDGGYDNPLRHTILMTNNWEKYHKKGSFKQGIGLKDISFKYTYMYYDGGEVDYTQPSPSRNAWHITKMGYLDGIPALFNPSPDGNTTYDVWYKYCGKKYINGKQYDGWTEPYVGDVVYIHYSEIIVDDTDLNTILESKEILRSVEYIRDVNDSESIIGYKFPKNIAPYRLYNSPYGMTFYFDYNTGIILDENKTNVGDITITEDERVLLKFSQTGAYAIIGPIDFNYDSLEYEYFEKDVKINTYNLYKGSGSGLPTPTKSGQVLVSNSDLEFEERDAVPMADNLTSAPETNDTMYSVGPTGGLADIQTGEESYLQEIKGYSIVWNQLIDSNHGLTPKSGHYYIYWDGTKFDLKGPDWNGSASPSSTAKAFDLTLMFGGNDNIPFSLNNYIEYEVNGNVPAQLYRAVYGFQRLFSHIALTTAQYDPGTIQHVSVNKLSETGQNLWDVSTMDGDNGTGLLLLAGYRYEIYGSADSTSYKRSYDGVNFTNIDMPSSYRKINAKGEMMWVLTVMRNTWVKSSDPSQPLVYIGFIHSGNHCLTDGGYNSTSYYKTNAVVPPFTKHEFNISGISNLKGIPDNSKNHCSVYDTVDTTRVKSVDLSTLIWTAGEGTFSAEINDIKADTTNLLATQYLGSEMSVSGTTITITTTVSPTGTLLYELTTPVTTGKSAFEPIPLKDSQGNWIINDMGSEYFTGLLVCPVNQVSYYYENLKDKLVNLEIPEIESISFKNNYTPLEGININGTRYRILPTMSGSNLGNNAIAIGYHLSNGYGYANSNYAVAIGYGASSGGESSIAIGNNAICRSSANTIAIGKNAETYGFDAVALGNGSSCGTGSFTFIGANYAVAIGSDSKNAIPYTVTFDGTTTDYQRTLVMFNPEKIFFRRELNSFTTTKNTLDKYAKGQHLSDFITNKALTLQDGKYYVSYTDASNYKTFTSNVISGTATDITDTITGVHITVVLTDNDTTPTWHSVVGMDLMLYDSTNSLPYNSYARINCGGTVEDITAYIDADGCVVITAPTGTVISSVKYNIK